MRRQKWTWKDLAKLVPAGALMVWTVLPALCAILCAANICCFTPKQTRVAQAAVCPRCVPTSGKPALVKHQDSQSCCSWIGSRMEPPVTLAKADWSVSPPAVLPAAIPTFASQTRVEESDPPAYTGLAPPGPVAFRPSGRAPPIA